MNDKVAFYQKNNGEYPVVKFLESLPKKHQAKAIWEIDLLAQYGTALKEPYAKAVKGEQYKGIWELRIKFASDISRTFYFTIKGDKFILLHGFIKKSDETPEKELATAKRNMDDYFERKE